MAKLWDCVSITVAADWITGTRHYAWYKNNLTKEKFQWVTKTTPPPNPTHKTKQHTLTEWKAGWLLASFSKALCQLSFYCCCCCWSFSPLKEGAGACWLLQSLSGCRHSALGTSLESERAHLLSALCGSREKGRIFWVFRLVLSHYRRTHRYPKCEQEAALDSEMSDDPVTTQGLEGSCKMGMGLSIYQNLESMLRYQLWHVILTNMVI